MTFYIVTLGCKVNMYESEMMKEKLLESGYLWEEENPQIVIVNTCAVTNVADQKSREMTSRMQRNFPNAILIVCGCSSEENETMYDKFHIDILLGNKDKSKIVSILDEYLKKKEKIKRLYHTRNLPFEDMSVDRFTTHTRAFIKVQDGCNNFCSYCIIPYVRGTIRSKELKDVLKEAECLVQNHHQEIVLTGIHTGSYLDSKKHDLTDLIHEMSKIANLKRIRISSIEVTELNDKFLNELQKNQKICNHLHIPLQAGSDEILKKMSRRYNLKEYEEKITKIRSIRKDISISTDIIVGFPTESNELFEETLVFARKMKFSKIHVFPFSKKEGTKAALYEKKEYIEEEEKKKRSKLLKELSKELERDYMCHFIGETLDVLIEKNGPMSTGLTSNYLKVGIMKDIPKNSLVPVKITNLENDQLIGEIKEKVLEKK